MEGHRRILYLHTAGILFQRLPNLDFVQCDLRNGQRVSQVLNEHNLTHVFHLGAQSLPTVSWADPVGTFESNVMGSLHLFEALRYMKRPPVIGVRPVRAQRYGHRSARHAISGHRTTSRCSLFTPTASAKFALRPSGPASAHFLVLLKIPATNIPALQCTQRVQAKPTMLHQTLSGN